MKKQEERKNTHRSPDTKRRGRGGKLQYILNPNVKALAQTHLFFQTGQDLCKRNYYTIKLH